MQRDRRAGHASVLLGVEPDDERSASGAASGSGGPAPPGSLERSGPARRGVRRALAGLERAASSRPRPATLR